MIYHIKAPNNITIPNHFPLVFLAGSIEMGTADKWQDRVVKDIQKLNDLKTPEEHEVDAVLYNPRRDDWDSSWVQSKDNQQFSEQVNWELSRLEMADIAFFYFDPNTKSPITIGELYMSLATSWSYDQQVIVCCPPGFHRKGNIDVTCDRYRVHVYDELPDAINELARALLDMTEERK